MVSTVVCIVDRGTTTDNYTNTATHELGHALGWMGHSTVNTDIMYAYCNGITVLSSAEKIHLSQIY